MIGNPEIRFQANEGVQKSISNNIRYMADKEEKAQYHAELEQQVEEEEDQDILVNCSLQVVERREMEALHKLTDREVSNELVGSFCASISLYVCQVENQTF